MSNCLIGTIPVVASEDGFVVGPVPEIIFERMRRLEGKVWHDSQLWLNIATGEIAFAERGPNWHTTGHQAALCELNHIEKTIQWFKDKGTWDYNRFSANDEDQKRADALYAKLPQFDDIFPLN